MGGIVISDELTEVLRGDEIDRLYLDLDSHQAKLRVSEHIIEPEMLIGTILSLRQWVIKARKLLEEVEWEHALDAGGDSYTACSVCGRADWDGHTPDCALAELLKEE